MNMVAPVLLGPADPDNYRTKVGRYHERWYIDPLPGDSIAPATDAAWPSFTTVKGAVGVTWDQAQAVAVRRIAQAFRADPQRLTGLDERDTKAVLSMWNEGDLARAGERGTAVHTYIENRLRGLSPLTDLSAGRDYFAAVDALFDAYDPTLVAAEIVVVHRHLNGTGYAGTIDAILMLNIGGRRKLVDWKSRDPRTEHAAYDSEAAQLGAYAGAEYAIVERDGRPVRITMDELDIDGGLIVSIRPDGCRVFPVDLGLAFDHYTAMHAWWNAQRTSNAPIGHPWAPVGANTRHLSIVPEPAPVADSFPTHGTTGTAVPDDVAALTRTPAAASRERLIDRIGELINAGHGAELALNWPSGVPGLTARHHTPDELVAILHVVQRVSDDVGLPFHADDGTPSLPTGETGTDGATTRHPSSRGTSTGAGSTRLISGAVPAVEGSDVDVGDLHALHGRFVALTAAQRAWIATVAAHADQAGRSISLNARPSVRRYEIGRALVLLVEQTWHYDADDVGHWDDVLVRAVLAVVGIDTDVTEPIGAAMSRLTPHQARWVADIAMAINQPDQLTIGFDADIGYVLSGPVIDQERTRP